MVNRVVAFAMSLEGDGAVGPRLFKVAIACSEMVVQGTFLPDAVFLACLDETLHVQVTQNLEEEHAAEQRQQQLFVHDDSRHGNDAANGQATRVAHEDIKLK